MLGVEIYWVGVWVWTAGFAIYLAGTFWWPSLNVARAGSILCLIGFLVTSYPFVEGFDFRAFVWPDDFSIGSLTPEVVDTLVAVTWVGGLVLVIASWLRIVSTKIGWVGFIVAMCAVVISWQDDPLSRGAVVAAGAVLLAILFSSAHVGKRRGPRPGDYIAELIRLCHGDRRQATRLINYELKRRPKYTRQAAAMAAVARLRHDQGS